jgi:transposase
MGQGDLRRLLVVGATCCIRWAKAKGLKTGSWLDRLLARKPAKMVAVALANKMARMLWAVVTKRENYKGDVLQYI